MRFLRSTEGKTKCETQNNKWKKIEYLKINIMKDKLINNVIRWHGHVLKMCEETFWTWN